MTTIEHMAIALARLARKCARLTKERRERMKSWMNVGAAFAVLCSALFAAGCATTPQPTVEWSGAYPAVYKDSIDMYGYGPDSAWVPAMEIGFRSDGVIVWREHPKAE